jgi:hypothetical protein
MPNVPNKPVARRIKDIMHRYGELNRAERRTGMAANTRARIDNKLPNLVRNFLQIFYPKPTQVSRRINLR